MDLNRNALDWTNRRSLPFEVVDEKQAKYARHYEHIVIDTPARPTTEELKTIAEGCAMPVDSPYTRMSVSNTDAGLAADSATSSSAIATSIADDSVADIFANLSTDSVATSSSVGFNANSLADSLANPSKEFAILLIHPLIQLSLLTHLLTH